MHSLPNGQDARENVGGWLSGAMSNPDGVRHGAIPGRDVPRFGAVSLLWAILDHLQEQGVELHLTPYHMVRGPLKATKKLLYELGAIPDETAFLDLKPVPDGTEDQADEGPDEDEPSPYVPPPVPDGTPE